jgi:hypothetical protein
MVAPTGEGRVCSSRGLALSLRDPQSDIGPFRVRPTQVEASRTPSHEVWRPSSVPIPVSSLPGTRSIQRAHGPALRLPGASPEGVPPAGDHIAQLRSGHCPTADGSVAVELGSMVRSALAREWTAAVPQCSGSDRCNAMAHGETPEPSGSARAFARLAPYRPRRGSTQPAAFARRGVRTVALSADSREPGFHLCEPELTSGSSGIRDHPRSSAGGSGCTSHRAWSLVARFQPRFVPPSPFLTTLAVSTSPGPSGLFHPVTLLGFGSRLDELGVDGGDLPARRPTGPPRLPRSVRAARVGSALANPRPPRSWQARHAARPFYERNTTGEPGPVPNAFALDRVKRSSVRHDRRIRPGSRGGSPPGSRSPPVARHPCRRAGRSGAPTPKRGLRGMGSG